MGLDLDKAVPDAEVDGAGAPEIDEIVKILLEALERADPDAWLGEPERESRTTVDGSFDLYAVAGEIRERLFKVSHGNSRSGPKIE